jgi:CHASE3 domain sensor protein
MTDDAAAHVVERLGRIEERLETFKKYIEVALNRHEDLDDERFARVVQDVRDQVRSFEKLVRAAIDAAIAAQDAKTAAQDAAERTQNALVRYLVLTACGAILLYFVNAVVSGWTIRPLPAPGASMPSPTKALK